MKPESKLPSIYVGCALTGAPEEFVKGVEDIKNSIRGTDRWEVLDFLGLTDGGNGEVYQRDIEECVKSCDAFVAVADHPATGLGWELGIADERKIPTLVVAKVGARVTRLVLGAAEVKEHITFARYGDMAEIPRLVEQYLLPLAQDERAAMEREYMI